MTTQIDPDDALALTQLDHAALELAVETARKEGPGRRQQIDSFLSSRDWFATATFCASCSQSRSLHLIPWQPAPCDIGNVAAALDDPDETRGNRSAAQLRLRMQRCGVSRWHPDPIAACEHAEAMRQ
jgi:hypothetical protein